MFFFLSQVDGVKGMAVGTLLCASWIFLAGVFLLHRSEQHDMLIQKRKDDDWTGEKPQNQERIAEVDAEYILGDDGELIEIRGEHFRSQPHG